MTVNELKSSKEYSYHHTGSRRGYQSRKTDGKVEEYKGRFGEGYRVIRPRWDTSKYVCVDYYIKTDA